MADVSAAPDAVTAVSSIDLEHAYADRHDLSVPAYARGPVTRGFQRGSRELGIPTANLDPAALGGRADDMRTGVYYGWASVGADPTVYKMVMSMGWNPYYGNSRKTVEPHLLHTFPHDFYDEELRIVITGFLRPELNFSSLDALVAAIRTDIRLAADALDMPQHAAHKTDASLAPASAAAASSSSASAATA